MAARPSEPLLRLLREVAQKKGLNTAALAHATEIDRTRLKHLLAGAEPLTVDEFMVISTALEISPADLGMPVPDLPDEDSEEEDEDEMDNVIQRGPALRAVARRERAPQEFKPDQYGNHAEQAMKLGFALGCDLFFITDVKLIQKSGVPRTVLARYPEHLPIRLDAAYHRHNDPRFLPEGLQLSLSFDSLCTCVFPWAAFRQITFFPLPPSEPEPEPEEKEDEDAPKGLRRGHLRLIE